MPMKLLGSASSSAPLPTTPSMITKRVCSAALMASSPRMKPGLAMAAALASILRIRPQIDACKYALRTLSCMGSPTSVWTHAMTATTKISQPESVSRSAHTSLCYMVMTAQIPAWKDARVTLTTLQTTRPIPVCLYAHLARLLRGLPGLVWPAAPTTLTPTPTRTQAKL